MTFHEVIFQSQNAWRKIFQEQISLPATFLHQFDEYGNLASFQTPEASAAGIYAPQTPSNTHGFDVSSTEGDSHIDSTQLPSASTLKQNSTVSTIHSIHSKAGFY